MEKQQITEELKKIVEKYTSNSIENFHTEIDFTQDLHISSYDFLNILLDIETHFSIEIADETMENIICVKEAVEAIYKEIHA